MATGLARGRVAHGNEAHNEAKKIRENLPKLPICGLLELSFGRNFRIHFAGPDGTPFAAAHFELDVFIVDGYPFHPPAVRLMDAERIFHPNVCPQSGAICLDILNNANAWSPSIGLEKLVMSIMSLLAAPCTDHGLNWEAVKLLRKDQAAYEVRAAKALQARCRKWVPCANSDIGEDPNDSDDEEFLSTVSGDVCAHDRVFAKDRMAHHKWQHAVPERGMNHHRILWGQVFDVQHKSKASAVNASVRESFENAHASHEYVYGIDDDADAAIHRCILTPHQTSGSSPGRARPSEVECSRAPGWAKGSSPVRYLHPTQGALGCRHVERGGVNTHNSQAAKTISSSTISL